MNAFFTTLTILLKLIGAWFNGELAISLWLQKWLLNLQSIFASGALDLDGQSAERTAHGGGGVYVSASSCASGSLFSLSPLDNN